MSKASAGLASLPSMKRIPLFLFAAVLLFFGGRALRVAMASDATRIGWLLAEEAAAFDGASLLNLLPHFATDFRDDTTGIDQPRLRAAVAWLWQNRRDAQGQFACRAALPEGAGVVEVDGDTATARFPLQLLARDAPDTRDAEPLWELQVEARLQRRNGAWWLVGSRHETTRGAQPVWSAK